MLVGGAAPMRSQSGALPGLNLEEKTTAPGNLPHHSTSWTLTKAFRPSHPSVSRKVRCL